MNGINLEEEEGPKWRVHFKGERGSPCIRGKGEAANMRSVDIGAFLNITEPSKKKGPFTEWPKIYGEFIAIIEKTPQEEFFPCHNDQKGWNVLTIFTTLYAAVIYGKVKSGKGIDDLVISYSNPQVTIQTRPWIIKPCPKKLLKEKLLLFDCPGVKYYSKNNDQELRKDSLTTIFDSLKNGKEREFAKSAFPQFAQISKSTSPCSFFSWGFIPFSTDSKKCIWVVNKQGDPSCNFVSKILNFEFCNVFNANEEGDLRGLCGNHHVILFKDVTPTKKPPLEFILSFAGTREFPFIVVVSIYGIDDIYQEPSPNIKNSFVELPMTGFVISVVDKCTKLDPGPQKMILERFMSNNLKQKPLIEIPLTEIFIDDSIKGDDIGSVADEKQEFPDYDVVLNKEDNRESVITKTAELLVTLERTSLTIPSFSDLTNTKYKRPCFTLYSNRESDEATAFLLKETSDHLAFLIKMTSLRKRKVALSLNTIHKHIITKSDSLRRFSTEEIEVMLEYLSIKPSPFLGKKKYTNHNREVSTIFTVINK